MGDIHNNRKTLFHNGPSKSFLSLQSHFSVFFLTHCAESINGMFPYMIISLLELFRCAISFSFIHKELYFEVCLLSSRKRQIRYSRYSGSIKNTVFLPSKMSKHSITFKISYKKSLHSILKPLAAGFEKAFWC